MAAGMKAVRQRIRSIESTRQVTRAMELAAAARLRGSRERAENVLPYFQALAQTMEAVCRGRICISARARKIREAAAWW